MNQSKLLSLLDEKINHYLEQFETETVVNNVQHPQLVHLSSASELNQQFEFEIDSKGVSEDEFIDLIDKYLEFSVKTGNKQFFNQLFSGFNLPAYIGEVLTAVTNTSMYTYEVAPVATLIETTMIRLMNSYTGYENGDGTFVTGGSNANLIAMFTARNHFLQDCSSNGYDGSQKLVAFVNEQAHYSFDTAANMLGLGTNAVIKIRSDAQGRMDVTDLELKVEQSIDAGCTPFFVGATCGTTVMGAFDPLVSISKICEEHQLWLHADGSFGGSILLSKQHRRLIEGIEKTHSFAWNPHKLMNIPLICSVLLINQRGLLEANITGVNTDYIYHDEGYSHDGFEDLGKKSIQCGRRVDAVKLWFAWKYYGIEGYESRIDHLIDIAVYAEHKVTAHKNLELVAERQSFSICFRAHYLSEDGTRCSNIDELNDFNQRLRKHLVNSGNTLVNYAHIGQSLAIRLVIANAELSEDDIDEFFEHMDQAVAELSP